MSGLEGLLAGHVLVKRYRIREVVGRGGFAAVYRADDLRLQRPVAVKVISIGAPDPETRAHLRERFQREARAAAALPHHPSLVTIHDYGTDAELDIDFLAMELLLGQDLAAYLAENGQPPAELGVYVLRAAAEGLAVGHRAGLIHRDVKPGNIFLAEPHEDEPFRVCMLDFGIARAIAEDSTLTRVGGAVPLSPRYASPEQRRGETALTPASDVFSLGVVGYQLLAGARPFGDDDVAPAETAFPPLRERNRDISPELEAVIHRALAFDATERYPDADAFVDALEAAVYGENTRAAPVVAPPPADDDERTVLQPAGAVPAAAGVGAAAGYAAASAPPPAPRAEPVPVGRVVPRETARRGGGFPRWLPILLVLALVGAAAVWALGRGGSGAEASERTAGQPAEPPAVTEEGDGDADAAATPATDVPAVPTTVDEGGEVSAPPAGAVIPSPAPVEGGEPRPASPLPAPSAPPSPVEPAPTSPAPPSAPVPSPRPPAPRPAPPSAPAPAPPSAPEPSPEPPPKPDPTTKPPVNPPPPSPPAPSTPAPPDTIFIPSVPLPVGGTPDTLRL